MSQAGVDNSANHRLGEARKLLMELKAAYDGLPPHHRQSVREILLDRSFAEATNSDEKCSQTG